MSGKGRRASWDVMKPKLFTLVWLIVLVIVAAATCYRGSPPWPGDPTAPPPPFQHAHAADGGTDR